MRLDEIARNASQRDTVQRGADGKITVPGDQGTCDIDLYAPAAFLEYPTMQRAAGKADTRAVVHLQITRLPGRPVTVEIVRRSHHGRLGVLADAERNHVLFDAVARPDAGVKTIAHDVGQCAVDDDLEGYRRIAPQEA